MKNFKDIFVQGGGGSGVQGRVNRKLNIAGRSAKRNQREQRIIRARVTGRAGGRASALNRRGTI